MSLGWFPLVGLREGWTRRARGAHRVRLAIHGSQGHARAEGNRLSRPSGCIHLSFCFFYIYSSFRGGGNNGSNIPFGVCNRYGCRLGWLRSYLGVTHRFATCQTRGTTGPCPPCHDDPRQLSLLLTPQQCSKGIDRVLGHSALIRFQKGIASAFPPLCPLKTAEP